MAEPPSQEHELQHFGKYLLDQELARGGMSRVFRARLRGPGGFEKKLVVKQVLPDLARDPSFIELFVKEANTLVQMSHPNLVPVYELGVIDGVYFLAMESVEGATVAELLEDGPLAPPLVAQIGAQIAEALRYAHERFQIVHRDVTPRNVIVDEAGHARLLDFGIAAPIGHEGRGELFGSPGYIAPEQLSGDPLGAESDLFSLGAVLYEALRGTPAFPEARRNAGQRESYRPAAPLDTLDTTEPAIATLVMRLVSIEREGRPKSAAEVAATLRTWLAEHHPQGVEQELAERARSANTARERRPVPSAESAAAVSSGRIEVRSLAVSPAMKEMLQQATLRIERESPAPPASERAEPDTTLENDPEGHVVFRRFLRDIIVITGALVVAIWLAERWPRHSDEDVVPETAATIPRAPTATENLVDPAAPKPSTPRALETPPVGSNPQPSATGASPVSPEPTKSPAAPADTTPPVSATPQPSAADTSPTPGVKPGYVTVSAAPWANVQLDGKDAGVTPRRHVPLKAGKHTLLLVCPPLGKEARVALDVQPEQNVQVVVDLNETPPRVKVR
jgi:serine/threonine-protein kinase